jgi:hypothetical protein
MAENKTRAMHVRDNRIAAEEAIMLRCNGIFGELNGFYSCKDLVRGDLVNATMRITSAEKTVGTHCVKFEFSFHSTA